MTNMDVNGAAVTQWPNCVCCGKVAAGACTKTGAKYFGGDQVVEIFNLGSDSAPQALNFLLQRGAAWSRTGYLLSPLFAEIVD